MTEPPRGDTIFALSSGSPPAAIAVVRVSGPAAGGALRELVGRLPTPRRVTVRTLRDEKGALLDQALLLWMPGPATATGEDLAEFHLHGGRAVVAAVLAALGRVEGCRPALAGEFTRRAFANGRLDLAEAEGLADLLVAETETARRQALRLVEGGLSRLAERWRARLLTLSARAEALLEFGDDEGDVLPDPTLHADIAAMAEEFASTLSAPPAERLRDGFRVIVAGPPNAGKSTLINALAGRDAAITAPEAGTTRDLIEVPVLLDGLPILLIDSAGLRDTEDRIERLGIARAEQAMAAADIVLWLGDDAAPVQEVVRIHARADLPDRQAMPADADLALSAATGAGLGHLRALLVDRLSKDLSPATGVLLNERHRVLIGAALSELSSLTRQTLPEIAAEHLRHALAAIDAITGRARVEEMLDALFSRFCVGK